MRTSKRALLALTIGDPAGIGPDIILKLLRGRLAADVVLLGDRQALQSRANMLNMQFTLPDYDPRRRRRASLRHMDTGGAAPAGRPSVNYAPGVLASLRVAARMAQQGECDAVVTAPVAKSQLAKIEPGFSGHTEFFAQLAGVKLPVMAMIGPRIKAAFVTTHLPLAAVSAAITAKRVCATLQVAEQGMRKVLGKRRVSWLVCGLNPHAGEEGLLGDEERAALIPGLRRARAQGIKLDGPCPADTAFVPGRLRDYDCVLAMYHDQALPVIKRDAFAATVNVTFGLPFVRTSVDHGTAFELAGSGAADCAPLRAACVLAAKMAAGR